MLPSSTGRRASGWSAVMNQRIEPLDSLDDFPTPPWATRALFEYVLSLRPSCCYFHQQTAWEPACNRGTMSEPMREYFKRVVATDIHHYGYASLHALGDFTDPAFTALMPPVDWIITNPPFHLALPFALRALELANRGVALLCRTNFLEGQERYIRLFRPHPATFHAVFAERVALVKGYDPETDLRGGYDPDASTATSYSWFVWIKDDDSGRCETVHIEPCKRLLEHETDRERFAKIRRAPLLDPAP